MGFFTKKLHSFTLIELLVTMAIIAVLAGMLGFSLAGVRERARRLQCMNNLRQIGLGIKQYASDNAEAFPESGSAGVETHLQLLSNMLQNVGQVFKCPSDFSTIQTNTVGGLTAGNVSYTYTRGLTESDPINVPIMWDKGVGSIPSGSQLTSFIGQSWIATAPHKNDGGNVLMSGAYVEFHTTFPDSAGKTNVVVY